MNRVVYDSITVVFQGKIDLLTLKELMYSNVYTMSYSFTTLVTGVNTIDDVYVKINDVGLKYKSDDDVVIIYSDVNQRTNEPLSDDIKSVIIDKKTFQPIVSQYNKIIYNTETIEFLRDKNWDNVSIKECYEGTMIIVFNHANKWYVCTRKCLDAKKSFWVKDVSYYDLFMEAIDGKFTFDDLNKEYCYHFILLHYQNKNIVGYPHLGDSFRALGPENSKTLECTGGCTPKCDKYKTVALAMTTEKYTLKKIDTVINDKIIYPNEIKCSSLQDAIDKLEIISRNDVLNHRISTEGYIIEYVANNMITLLKMQTRLYTYVASVKPNVNNLAAMFLELYQNDHLVNIVPFFVQNSRDVVGRIHNSMKTLSMEFLQIYHSTRNHKNPEIYNQLPKSYKDILYAIHGIYKKKIENELNKQQTQSDTVNTLIDRKSITVYDTYNCLKKIDPYTLRRAYIDRIELLDIVSMHQYLNRECFDTLLQGRYMC